MTLLERFDSVPASLSERVASLDQQYGLLLSQHDGLLLAAKEQLDAHHKRLLQHDLVLSRHDSEIESLLRHDHTHEVEAAPRSDAATVTQ